jgi:hypothetical protein
LEIFALLKSLKIRDLENYSMSVCYITLSLTPSDVNLCEIVKAVHKTLETVEDRAYYSIYIYSLYVSR